MEKTFSPDFKHDILDLLEKCIEAKTDSMTITFEYNKAILDIDLTFRVYSKEEE